MFFYQVVFSRNFYNFNFYTHKIVGYPILEQNLETIWYSIIR